jgi:hypothetical protein
LVSEKHREEHSLMQQQLVLVQEQRLQLLDRSLQERYAQKVVESQRSQPAKQKEVAAASPAVDTRHYDKWNDQQDVTPMTPGRSVSCILVLLTLSLSQW